ncbi:TRAP transporter small permease [Aquisalibacillus elongatus]|uniref:TRAP-type C4-dicarboxylate transport system permease small subunit n=1 Tax=Aquisalibacillus elongatus TaxID=485577 RepID=A0A3N5C7I3_9BACI|nr:TRAP transporter small permease [Aquisalibacillus elongatus]RPF54315.1 TRAP-type C4-dicarboxylate transport system permease small subunit [Aquisalibacillus elongatus]
MFLLKKIEQHIEEWLLVIIGSVMTTVIFLQVVMREMGSSLSWSEELGRYCFIWLVYIGISYGVKKQRHIKVDVILFLLKGKWKVLLSLFANLLFLIFAVLVVYYGSDISSNLLRLGQKSPALQVEMGLVYLAAPIGMGLTVIRLIQNMYRQILMLIGKKEMDVADERERVLEEKEEVTDDSNGTVR